jgi:hypothetical protein
MAVPADQILGPHDLWRVTLDRAIKYAFM